MKDKSKKLLKKGLRLAGAIGLTTLVLGGSLLLGFEVGKATYQPKEEKSLSAAKAKSALQPKRTAQTQRPTLYMTQLVGAKDLYIRPTDELKAIAPKAVFEYSMTLNGTFEVVNDYTNKAGDGETFHEASLYVSGNESTDTYQVHIESEYGDFYMDNGILNISTIASYTPVWDGTTSGYATDFNADDLIRLVIARVTERPYVEVNGMTNWAGMLAEKPLGMSMASYASTISTQPFLAHTKHLFGVEIGGTYFRVYAWIANWTMIPDNTEVEIAGQTINVPFETFQALPYIDMAIADGDTMATRFATNLYADPIKKVVTDGRPSFWNYGMNSQTAKIFDWGSMKDHWNVYPNEGSGWADNTAYLKSAGADYVNTTGVYLATESGLLDVFTLIGSALGGFTSILSVALLPGLTIGTLILVPFIVTMVIVIIKMLRK